MRRGLIKAVYYFGITAGAIVAIILVLAGLANTGVGQRAIAFLVEPLSGGKAVLVGLSGRFPDRLRLDHVEIRDENGAWLVIDNATLDWSPFALLRKRLEVTRFEAERLAVLRLPSAEENRTLSLTVEVRSLRIGRIQTDASVSHIPMTLAAEGALRYSSWRDWNADLSATRLDARGSYRLRASFKDGFLEGAADIDEPPGGLLAGLLGLNDIGPLAVHASGSGPREANVIQFMLEAGPMRAMGRGTIDYSARTAELDFSAQAPAMSVRPDLSWQSLSAIGHLRGPLDNPDVNADLEVQNLQVQDIRIAGVGAKATGRRGGVDFTASFSGLRLPGAEGDLFARAPIAASGRVEFQTPARAFRVLLSHPLLSVEAQGQAGDMKRLLATVTVPDIAPFAERGGIDIRGRATLGTNIAVVDAGLQIAVDGMIVATGGAPPVARLIGRNAHLALRATVDNANISISDARLDGAAASARLSGRMRGDEIDTQWTLTFGDLSQLTPRLVGQLRIQGQARGPFQTARLNATAIGEVGTPTIRRQQITFSANALGLPQPRSGDFHAQSRFYNAPLSLVGEFSRTEQRGLKIAVRQADWKSLRARADLTISDTGLASGTARMRLSQLQDIASILGQPIRGSLEADIGFNARRGGTYTSIRALARDIEYHDLTARSLDADIDLNPRNDEFDAKIAAQAHELAFQDATIRSAAITGQIADPIGSPSLALAIDAVSLSVKELSGNASARLDGRPNTMTIGGIWEPRDASGNPGQVSATANLALPEKRILFTAFQARYRGETATIERPVTIRFDDGIEVDQMLLNAGHGRVSLNGRIVPRLSLNATAQNISTSVLTPYMPELSPAGTLSATAELSGTLASPQGTIDVQGRGLRARSSPPVVVPASLDAHASLQGGRVSLNADLTAGPSVRLSVSGDVSLDSNPALGLNVTGTGDLSVLNPMLSAEGRNLRGLVVLNASVGGTFRGPTVSGRANLSAGEIQDVQRSLHIRDIALVAEAGGDRIRITQFSGRAGDGTISATGTVDLSTSSIPVDLTITAQNARPLVSDRFNATMDGNLRVTGALRSGLTVAGTINLTRGEITLPDRFPPGVVVLDVRRPRQISSRTGASQPPVPIRLDLTISTRGRVFLRGRGIDAEVEGTIGLGGNLRTPQVRGGFELRRGTFTVAGQTLDFTSGKVTFDGMSIQNRIDPALDLAAQTISGGITATLAVTGYASAPRIELSSVPQLPQDEILARIFFRRSTTQLTPVQLVQLAQTALSLASGDTRFDPLRSLERGLGLSRLTIGSREAAGQATPETTIEAGTYVLRNVYVGARQSLGSGTQAEVQINLTDKLKLLGTVNTGANANVTQGSKQRETGSSIGLSYEFEY